VKIQKQDVKGRSLARPVDEDRQSKGANGRRRGLQLGLVGGRDGTLEVDRKIQYVE
jgi:hypothetical protein